MNYTRPLHLEQDDLPIDWLASSLTFARALGLILKEKEGHETYL